MVPLPRHILQDVSGQGIEAIQNHPYWSHEFVGAGPFKLTRWERGSHLEAAAFDQHVLGRPKIDRVQVQFIADPNTAFANLLAGSTDVAMLSITFPQMVQLKQQWAETKQGTAGYTVAAFGAAYFQNKPEYARPRAGLDLAVRKALAHGLDRQTLADTIGAGELRVMDTIFDPTADYYPTIERAITKYSYDPRASERLMTEAGYTKGSDGIWSSPGEGRLTFSISGPPARLEPPVMAANWRQIGFDIEERVIQLRGEPGNDATVPFIYNNSYTAAEVAQFARYKGSELATAENRWHGENIHGWVNPAFDRLVDAFIVTLDANERVQQRAQMAKIMSEELPAIQLLTTPNPHAVLARVKNVSPTTRPGTMGRITWNIHNWEIG
jgi:peptide/nickel transport system substrate-binding protein